MGLNMITMNRLTAWITAVGRRIARFLVWPGTSDGVSDPEYEEAMNHLNQTGDASWIQEYLFKKTQEKKQGS
jgi:hypothetical protein